MTATTANCSIAGNARDLRLIADIGGTNARFALSDGAALLHVAVLPCADYAGPASAAAAYLTAQGFTVQSAANGRPITRGAFAVATPVTGDRIQMTNHVWNFSVEETRRNLGLGTLEVINDFTAIALSIPRLAADDVYKVGGGTAQPLKPIGIIGPGTGLGVGAVVFDKAGNPIPVATEGGHVTMPATNRRAFDIFETLKEMKYHHISAERVVSGKGLVNLYNAICALDKVKNEEKTPAEITTSALNKSCNISIETIDLFCNFLGTVAGNLALSYGAHGGVYIAGGIVPQLGENVFKASGFYASFCDKGRFRDYLAGIPVYVVTHPYPGLLGLI